MSDERGYMYRVARADKQQLQDVIAMHLGESGWTFGGATQWDFDPYVDDKHTHLRDITPIVPGEQVNIKGDFGHAFNKDIEIRWKRRDDAAYDVLILSETPLSIAGAVELCVRHWDIQTQSWVESEWTTQRPDVAAIHQTAGRPSLLYINYCAPNGAVQFQRLAGEK